MPAIQKISDLIRNLKRIKDEHGDLELVYSIDDEGNAFRNVFWEPSVGYFNEDDFYDEGVEDWEDHMKINSVCIN